MCNVGREAIREEMKQEIRVLCERRKQIESAHTRMRGYRYGLLDIGVSAAGEDTFDAVVYETTNGKEIVRILIEELSNQLVEVDRQLGELGVNVDEIRW